MPRVFLRGPVGAVFVEGAVNLAQSLIDLLVTVHVPADKAAFTMAESFTDKDGNPLFGLQIRGKLQEPEVSTIPAGKKDMLTLQALERPLRALRQKAEGLFRKIFQ
jgi:hypothetical protein